MNDDKIYEMVAQLARIEAMLQSNMELMNSKASKADLKTLEEKIKTQGEIVKAQDERIDKLENDKIWQNRYIMGIIITAVMGLIMLGGK